MSALFQEPLRFDGPDLGAADHHRLTGQLLRIANLMSDAQWRSLPEISAATGDPEASISAQLRHLRKPRFGSHIVERRRRTEGLYEYRLLLNRGVAQVISALFVETGGVYFGVPGVDPWDKNRNALFYCGTDPVICHSDCARWGRYWSGGPSAKVRRIKGDDGGHFAFALSTVRRVGGVLEHPEASHAWAHFGLVRPPRLGGWVPADTLGGWTCCVEQGHYGHPARKATWLYAFGVELPQLAWGPSKGSRLDEGFHSKAERLAARAAGRKPVKRLSKTENLTTPPKFRDLLISIVQTAANARAA